MRDDEEAMLRRRLDREIARRTSAEAFAETRTRQLFGITEELRRQLIAVTTLQEQLESDAVTDPLTGVMNRRGLFRWLDEQLLMQRSVALAYVDVIDFKSVNDRFNHATGDEVLRVIAQRFSMTVGPDAIVARIGGDEFVVAVQSAGDESPTDGNVFAERVTSAGDDPIPINENHELQVGVRCGVAQSLPGDSADRLVSRADYALGQSTQLRTGLRNQGS